MDDLSPKAVASTLGIDEHTVQTCLKHADAFLRGQLQDANIEIEEAVSPADSLVIRSPFSLAATAIERELEDLLRIDERSD